MSQIGTELCRVLDRSDAVGVRIVIIRATRRPGYFQRLGIAPDEIEANVEKVRGLVLRTEFVKKA